VNGARKPADLAGLRRAVCEKIFDHDFGNAVGGVEMVELAEDRSWKNSGT